MANTPEQDKAIALTNVYYNIFAFNNTYTNFNDAMFKRTKTFLMAARAAGICVTEIIQTCPQKENEVFGISKGIEYWHKVVEAIQAL